MTELGEYVEDPRLRKTKEEAKVKFPLMSKEMNEFYKKHS